MRPGSTFSGWLMVGSVFSGLSEANDLIVRNCDDHSLVEKKLSWLMVPLCADVSMLYSVDTIPVDCYCSDDDQWFWNSCWRPAILPPYTVFGIPSCICCWFVVQWKVSLCWWRYIDGRLQYVRIRYYWYEIPWWYDDPSVFWWSKLLMKYYWCRWR